MTPAGEEIFTIELMQSPGSYHLSIFDIRTQAGEHLVNLRREAELLASAKPHHICSYRGFEIFAQRQQVQQEGAHLLLSGDAR